MYAGRFGAISSARRASAAGKRHDAMARARKERQKAEKIVDSIMQKYDTDKSGALSEAQVIELLTDLDYSTPPGTQPSAEEICFVMQVADKSKSKAIERGELIGAITIWNSYLQDKDTIDAVLNKYDTDKSGSLSKEQAKALLTELNEGLPPSQDEVDQVFQYADVCVSGDLKRVEVLLAINYWYHMADEKRGKQRETESSGCCSLL
eukprot:Rhum_TRINITY_DN12767_c0_g2::Rhum_TRINITY_DN12767_c0_g2_i1::g.54212::m.54212